MGVYKSDSWNKASVFNPLTGDVALMATLIGGETFLAPQEEIVQQTTNGNYISQWRHRVQFACSDWDAFDTLKGFKDGHIAVQAVAAAESLNCANLQWYESVQIKELRKVPKPRRADGDSHFVVILEYEGDENAAIFNNVNLLHQSNVNGVVVNGFVDSDADGIADGYASSNWETESFADGFQTLENTDGDSARFSIPVVFPIDIKLTAGCHYSILSGSQNFVLSTNAFATGEVNSITNANVTTGQTNKLSLESQSNSFTVIIFFCKKGNNNETELSEPFLMVGNNEEYIAG